MLLTVQPTGKFNFIETNVDGIIPTSIDGHPSKFMFYTCCSGALYQIKQIVGVQLTTCLNSDCYDIYSISVKFIFEVLLAAVLARFIRLLLRLVTVSVLPFCW